MAKRISVINFKGGVGKTTLAFHLACGLERYHHSRVLLIDIDHQSSLSILCLGPEGWEQRVDAGLTVDSIFQHFTVPGKPLPGREILHEKAMSRPWLSDYENSFRYPRLDIVPATLRLDETEIALTSAQFGDAISSEWRKRTLLCEWLESTGLDATYDYIVVDCPPATKIVTQNAIALSHGYVIPVVPEAVMERGAPHLQQLISKGIAQALRTSQSKEPDLRSEHQADWIGRYEDSHRHAI